MTLLLCVRCLGQQEGVYWVVPDPKSAVGALRTYQEGGHNGDDIHHQYAHPPGAESLAPKAAINIVVTPSHWVTAMRVPPLGRSRKRTSPRYYAACTPSYTIGCTSKRLSPLGCNMHTRGKQTMSEASACQWIGSPVTRAGT